MSELFPIVPQIPPLVTNLHVDGLVLPPNQVPLLSNWVLLAVPFNGGVLELTPVAPVREGLGWGRAGSTWQGF